MINNKKIFMVMYIYNALAKKCTKDELTNFEKELKYNLTKEESIVFTECVSLKN